MENDDHADLSKIFRGVGDNVPNSIARLCEEHQNLIRCKSKNWHQWHLKYVKLFNIEHCHASHASYLKPM